MQIYLQKFPIPKLIDTVEIEIPGERVKSITSASRLLKEVEFFMGANGTYSIKNDYCLLINNISLS